MTTEEYLKSKGFKYQVVDSPKGKQARVKTCPFCGSKDFHFYINLVTGQYICHHASCDQAGSIYTLKKYLGDVIPVSSFSDLATKDKKSVDVNLADKVKEAHQLLMKDKEVLKYLHLRRFSRDAVIHFKLGCSIEEGVKWLWYPYILGTEVKNVKKRALPPADKAFKRIYGGQSAMFNERALFVTGQEEIIIAEGEADCVALWSMGMDHVVGVTIGAGGINNQWIEQLDKFQRIYFVYDPDAAGKKGATKFATRLGLNRCYNIKLPPGIKDVNDYFIAGHSGQDFLKLKETARQFDVEDVRPLSTLIQDTIVSLYIGDKDLSGLTWPWPSLTKIVGTMMPGDLVVVGGKPATGKTGFALNVLTYLSIVHNVPTLLFELEMRPERMLPRIVSIVKKKPTDLVFSVEELASAYETLKEVPFYFAYKWKRPEWAVVEDTVKMCQRRYGIKFMVFDNLHFLCRSVDQTREVSMMIQNFKMLAEEVGIPILVIARPRKMVGSKIMDMDDLKDSADMAGDPDSVILLHRERRAVVEKTVSSGLGTYMPETLVRVDKARYNSGGDIYLRAIDESGIFEEI